MKRSYSSHNGSSSRHSEVSQKCSAKQRIENHSGKFNGFSPSHVQKEVKPQSKKHPPQKHLKYEPKLGMMQTIYRAKSITEMINKAKPRKEPGTFGQRVVQDGFIKHPNATSLKNPMDGSLLSSYYPQSPSRTPRRRQKKISIIGEKRAQSQIASLPASRPTSEEPKPQRPIRRDSYSHINELPGTLKIHPKDSPPKVRQNPQLMTSTDLEVKFGPGRQPNQSKRRIEPSNSSRSIHPQRGSETLFNSSGKSINRRAQRANYQQSSQESQLIVSSKKRPSSARNLFESSLKFLS